MRIFSTTLFLLLAACTFSGEALYAQTASEPCKGKSEALECLGGVSGMMLYNTYIAIGAIADGANKDVYDDATVMQLMEEQIGALAVVDSQLISLNNSGFITDPEDKTYMSDLSKTVNYLKQEAYYLKRYTSSDLQSDLDEYNYYRDKAWNMIAELLGIEEE